MNTSPLASLYDVSLNIHMVCGLVLILLAVALIFLSVAGKKDAAKLETAMKLSRLFGPFAGILIITGTFQIIDGKIEFFQVWLIGGIFFLIGAMGALGGSWTPNARAAIAGEGDEAALKKAKDNCVNLAVSILIMWVAAYGLMEGQPF